MRALLILSTGLAWAAAASLDLLAVEDEEEALTLIKSASFSVKSVGEREISGLIKRQWWEAAETLILQSHEQSVDVSKHVRDVVKAQRSKLDALVQKLDPKHATIQRVSPAFQWAQNSSAVFLQVKYAARWNAPGSLDLNPLNISFTKTGFHLDGMGAHSGVTKQYLLALETLDFIDTERSMWQTASVGKLTVTIVKLHPGKVWPRLLLDKAKKISNMGVWSGMQEKQKESSPCQNSAALCAAQSKLYCVKTDRCVAECKICDDGSTQEHESRCIGKPPVPSVGDLKDSNGEKGKWSGQFTVSVSDESEISEIVGYISNETGVTGIEKQLDGESPPEALFRIPSLGYDQYMVTLKSVKLAKNASSTLAIFTRNGLKTRGTPLLKPLTDAAVPTQPPASLDFSNLLREADGNLSGQVILTPGEELGIDGYNVYAGKSAKTRLNRKVLGTMTKVPEGSKKTVIKHDLSGKIGAGATHLLVFPKNTHGEGSAPIAKKLPPVGEIYQPVPKLAPLAVEFVAAWRKDSGSLSGQVTVVPTTEKGVTGFSLYAGKNERERADADAKALANVTKPEGSMLDGILFTQPNATSQIEVMLPAGSTHLLAYAISEHGESDVAAVTALPPIGTIAASVTGEGALPKGTGDL